MNITALIVLGLIMQTGGAYLVNVAVECFAGSEAVTEYASFMGSVTQMEPRQYIHVLFVSPILEEIVFRLIFLRAGRMVMPFWAANLVQAVLFGFYHTFTIQRVYGFVMGLIIGCVFGYCPVIDRKVHDATPATGFLDLPDCLIGAGITIILHMVINAAGLFLTPLFPADIPVPSQMMIGILLMAVAAVVCIILKYETQGRFLRCSYNDSEVNQ